MKAKQNGFEETKASAKTRCPDIFLQGRHLVLQFMTKFYFTGLARLSFNKKEHSLTQTKNKQRESLLSVFFATQQLPYVAEASH